MGFVCLVSFLTVRLPPQFPAMLSVQIVPAGADGQTAAAAAAGLLGAQGQYVLSFTAFLRHSSE